MRVSTEVANLESRSTSRASASALGYGGQDGGHPSRVGGVSVMACHPSARSRSQVSEAA